MPTTHQKNLNPVSARVLFGQALRRARIDQKLSQEEVAHRAELDRSYIGQVERAVKNISIDNMEHLANAVGLQVWEMIRPPET